MGRRRIKARKAADAASTWSSWAKCAQFLDEEPVPSALDKLDIPLLALRSERIGAVLLAAFLTFGGNPIALQQTGELMCIEFTGCRGPSAGG